MNANLKEMEQKYGTVEFQGKEYILTQQAYVDDCEPNGEARYYADAVDEDGNEFLVEWETTVGWDEACELVDLESVRYPDEEQLERIEELRETVFTDCCDESNACDWEHPLAVTER